MDRFAPDAYVVRAGWRGFGAMLLALLGWTGLSVAALHAHHLTYAVPKIAIVGVFEVVFLAETGRRAWLAVQRKVVFAVDAQGVFFSDGLTQQHVPWSAICAVELFSEHTHSGSSGTAYRCVGVRCPGTRQIPRPGNGPAAQPLPERGAEAILRAGRPDLIPGYDGTIRYAYRRMTGWRVNRIRLAHAVRRYAAGVPVIDGPRYPPALRTGAAAQSPRRVRTHRDA
jgi:hypothetical protein